MGKVIKISLIIVVALLGISLYINYTLSDAVDLTGSEVYTYDVKPYKLNINIQQEVKDANQTTAGIDGTVASNTYDIPTDLTNYAIHDRAKPYWGYVVKYSNDNNIDPVWFASMITNESTWDPNVTSSVGAAGLCQIVPVTWSVWGEGSPYDPEGNIKAGTALFDDTLKSASKYGYNDRDTKGALGEQYHHALLIYGSGEGNYQSTGRAGTKEAQGAYNNEVKYYKGYISGTHPIGDKW